jgi:DNA repair protein RecN (Recombination protein N)
LALIKGEDREGVDSLIVIQSVMQELRPFENIDSNLGKILELFEQSRSILMDAQAELEYFSQSLDIDPEVYNDIESKLSLISRLKRKYNSDTEGLVTKLLEAQEELRQLEKFDDELELLKTSLSKIESDLKNLGRLLHEKRSEAAAKLSRLWEKGLKELGMSHARLELICNLSENFRPQGMSSLESLFSANVGQELKPLHKVASGGELSRILLALKQIVSTKQEICAYLFDEIDTGLGGEIAHRVATTLKKISQSSQVIVVTHLAQIAAYSDNHFSISKTLGRAHTQTHINQLTEEKRLHEIARMLGASESKAALALAMDLVSKAKKNQKSIAPSNNSKNLGVSV